MIAFSFRIHGPRGILERARQSVPNREKRTALRTSAHTVPVVEVMSSSVICALPDLEIRTLVQVMVQDRLGCVPVVDEREYPVGIVTKFDVVEQLMNPPTERARSVVSDIMMPLAITLDDSATVAQAATLMAHEDMHHVMIVRDRQLVGVVSTMDITRWLAENDRLANGGQDAKGY